jgi:hypothetical protein
VGKPSWVLTRNPAQVRTTFTAVSCGNARIACLARTAPMSWLVRGESLDDSWLAPMSTPPPPTGE